MKITFNKLYQKSVIFLLLSGITVYAELIIVDSVGDQSAVNPAVSAVTAMGTITLRSALERADANGDASNEINFDIPLNQQTDNHWIIEPQLDYPIVFAKQLIIDGYPLNTADPASPNTNPIDQANNANIKIEIRGPGAGVDLSVFDGIDFIFADNSIVRGLIFNNFASYIPNLPMLALGIGAAAIFSFATNNMLIEGCFFGVDYTGTQSLPNFCAILLQECVNGIVGGTAPASRNLLSGMYDVLGVVYVLLSTDTTLQGNTIGLDRSGTAVVAGYGNARFGLQSEMSENTLIGGSIEGRNVISGQGTFNVRILGDSNTEISFNYIGTDITGTKGFIENGVGVALDLTGSLVSNNLISGNSKGVSLGQNGFGVLVPEAEIRENIIGLDVTGLLPLPNRDDGIYLNFAIDTLIVDNIISANKANGIRVAKGLRTTIIGNLIGTDITGTAVFGNDRNGIQLGSLVATGNPAKDDVVGGANDADRNVIAGNKLNGIEIVSHAVNEHILNNYIGTSITGDQILRPNCAEFGNDENGVLIWAASNNLVQNNLITQNQRAGVAILSPTGSLLAIDNAILANSIYNNGGLGIDLEPNGVTGVTPNDYQDPDLGPNRLQNFPCLKVRRCKNDVRVRAILNSLPHTTFLIQFFDTQSLSKIREGQTFIGEARVTTNARGNACVNMSFPFDETCGLNITATATRLDNEGNPVETSEFGKGRLCLSARAKKCLAKKCGFPQQCARPSATA